MIKVAIIGCGKQADAHASLIERLSQCEIVGVCDQEELMARQLFERFKVKGYFSNVEEMLEVSRPDIVHITTPPQSHLELGRLCFEAGCHVFFEKPFALNTEQAESLLALAADRGLKLTVGYNNQFNPATLRMRELIKGGYLGGGVVHMESMWCYDLGDQRFAKALLGEKTHWVRRLPGKLLHNIINHGVGKIAEFMEGNSPRVIAHGFSSPFLRSMNEDIVDELRVIISDEGSTTAYFSFSTQIKPMIRQFRIHGPRNSLVVDDMHQTVIKVSRTDYKSYLNHFVPPWIYARQYISGAFRNICKFVKGDLNFDFGRMFLIDKFYRAVTDGTDVPIPYREILLTSTIMDAIFEQIGVRGSEEHQRLDNRGRLTE